MEINEIAYKINSLAKDYRMGSFQDIRKEIHSLQRPKTREIFSDQTITDEWAFHSGGRHEIQFNIGFEEIEDKTFFRYGIAFSLETSQTLPSIENFEIKIQRYNEFLDFNSDQLGDLFFWYYSNGQRSETSHIQKIDRTLFQEGNFIFVGRQVDANEIIFDDILRLFDRLIDLYIYVESRNDIAQIGVSIDKKFKFRPGCGEKLRETARVTPARKFEIDLRHNQLQAKIYDNLVSQYGEENVGTENETGFGTKIDIVVRAADGFYYYEIKTNSCLKACIREALSQLLEYSYWPNSNRANKLVIVSENDLSADSIEYLKLLRSQLNIPVHYNQFNFEENKLYKLF